MLENRLGQEAGYDHHCYYEIPGCIEPLLKKARSKLYKERDAAMEKREAEAEAYYQNKYKKKEVIDIDEA